MENTKLKKELIHAKSKRPSDFWGYAIATVSILHGDFIYRIDGYLVTHAEPYLSKLPEKGIGLFLLFAGVIKLVGLISRNKYLKKISIWMLSAIWGGLSFVSITYSFGTGYPDPYYIFMIFVLVACLRVSSKGDYKYDA
ncbi:hypothetical protein [Carnobacterium antarcticum]|uniref:Uncharacterized protein n=1 Tax=Carnobacterium antarcticum TaxID=2126436 RepID=A0ABW4NND6_9LACT|nr:hypothetical protein [Carnobacterium sp. CP1]ALV20772.1 hypothetical protein NY10_147 [Carnobacterium sp. CP1]